MISLLEKALSQKVHDFFLLCSSALLRSYLPSRLLWIATKSTFG
ncbi:hypothetical protein FDUTEX481_02441 [Tolypothrix sp. PCC 7601]|nr:hypothetical protein FDUTEX481_02441 [Tolypothrix sp. PCC 7601]